MTSRRTFIAGLGGAGLALGAAAVLDAMRYVNGATPPSTQAVTTPLGPGAIDPSWVISGTPTFGVAGISETPDGCSVTGLWSCTGPTVFKWMYGMDETVHVIEGSVNIEYLSRRFTLMPGDSATFHGGTEAIWHVPDRVKKVWTLQKPGALVHGWRKVLRLLG